MAAAEYFSNASMETAPPPYAPFQEHTQHGSPYQRPTQPTSHPSPQVLPQLNTAQSPAPQGGKPGVHFAPTPLEVYGRHHSFSNTERPQQPWAQPSQQPHNMSMQHRPNYGYSNPSSGYGTPPQQPPNSQFLSPHMRPYANPNASKYSLDSAGYSSDPEQRRRRHKHRNRRDNGESRSVDKPHSRSKNADAFMGAAGGGLIGDLIFPGLGTVGGAALGWLGGKDYANHRKGREDKRQMEQREWERKYGERHSHRERSDSRERSRRRSSGDKYERR